MEFGSDGIGMLHINGMDVVARAIQFIAAEGEVAKLILEVSLIDVDVKLGALKIGPS